MLQLKILLHPNNLSTLNKNILYTHFPMATSRLHEVQSVKSRVFLLQIKNTFGQRL